MTRRIVQMLAVCAMVVAAQPAPSAAQTPGAQGGQHDFDFEFGDWKAHVSRLLHPLTGDKHWVEYDGTSVVHPLWGGRANIGELDVTGPAGHILGASLRFYNPDAHQWNVTWVNSHDGMPGTPLVGGFQSGRGAFYDEDTLDGRSIYARFIFSDVTPASFKIVQSFSADGGKTWEPNWVATFTKVSST